MIFSAHLSVLFADVPLLERPAAARAAGYEAVESWWPGLQAYAFMNEVHRYGLRLMLLNAECGDIAAGERGFLNVPEPRQQVLSDIAKAVESRPRYVNVLVGRGDGLECVLDVLGEAVQTAEDVTLVVEHLNERDVPGYLLPTPEAAATLVENVRSPRLRLLYDAYHARMTGLDPAQDVANYKDLIAHVHYSEAPRRGAPGPDFWTSVAALEDMGYAGHLGLEYIASGDFRGPPVPEQLWQQRGPTR